MRDISTCVTYQFKTLRNAICYHASVLHLNPANFRPPAPCGVIASDVDKVATQTLERVAKGTPSAAGKFR